MERASAQVVVASCEDDIESDDSDFQSLRRHCAELEKLR